MDNITGIKDSLKITVVDRKGNRCGCRETYHATPWQRVKKMFGCRGFCEDLVVDQCLQDIATFLTTQYRYISIGTGVTPTLNTATGLEAEILTRALATASVATSFYSNDTAVFQGTFNPTYDISITESGMHKMSNSTGDRMAAREVFPSLSCPASQSLILEWRLIVMR